MNKPTPTLNRYTLHEVAAMLERTSQTISKTAHKHNIGTAIHQRLTLFTDDDVAKLRALCTGKGQYRTEKEHAA